MHISLYTTRTYGAAGIHALTTRRRKQYNTHINNILRGMC